MFTWPCVRILSVNSRWLQAGSGSLSLSSLSSTLPSSSVEIRRSDPLSAEAASVEVYLVNTLSYGLLFLAVSGKRNLYLPCKRGESWWLGASEWSSLNGIKIQGSSLVRRSSFLAFRTRQWMHFHRERVCIMMIMQSSAIGRESMTFDVLNNERYNLQSMHIHQHWIFCSAAPEH